MVKTLSKHGNSLALIIDRAILELLKIEQDTPLEISTDGERLVVKPIRDESRRNRVRHAAKQVMDTHEETLRKLAE